MKRCPNCNADYYDNMLEFCLEDGTRLTAAPYSAAATTPLVTKTAEPPIDILSPLSPLSPMTERKSEETIVLPGKDKPADTIFNNSDDAGITASSSAPARVIEKAPIVLALAHNWWQWLYLEKSYVYSVTDFLLSANFLMWLLLLAVGTAAGIYSVRNSKNKGFAIIGLVALAVNLILYIVPRR